MVKLRMLSDQGTEKFVEYIQNLKNNSQAIRPVLNNEPYSYEFKPSVDIDELKTFSTRMEMGKYLKQCLDGANIGRADVIGNRGLWTWLTYIWFDQICPIVNGTRKVRETARYICSLDYTDYFRHYVAGSYDIYSLHGEILSRIFLKSPLDIINDFVEVFACRQYIISNRNLIEVVDNLYWDINLSKPKRGSVVRTRPGHIRRLEKVLRQFELTFDVYSMQPPDILNLLPEEFNTWEN